MARPGEAERYPAALRREIAAAAEPARPAATVYVGGGTPTLLEPGRLGALLEALAAAFALVSGAEITVEANPGTLGAGRARELRAAGFTRVSLGVQSLDDALLARLGRVHTAAEAVAAFRALRAAGFGNLGIDLIHGLPGQRPEGWRRDLRAAIALGPEHLSLYALSVEEGTPFAAARARGELPLPSEEEELAMLEIAREESAAAGYERYEISSWARPGFRSRHNLAGWRLGEYRGFGAAAHSFLRDPEPMRRANVPEPEAYVAAVEAGRDPVGSVERPAPRRLAGEALMLGLRTIEGVEEEAFAAAHGAAPGAIFPEAVGAAQARGWLERAGGRLRFTPVGLLFSNVTFRSLF